MSLCLAGSKQVADIVRFTHLHKNEEFLRKVIFLGSKWKMNVWMNNNPEWKFFGDETPVTPHTNHTRVTPSRNTSSEIEANSLGSLSLFTCEDDSTTVIKNRHDYFLCMND